MSRFPELPHFLNPENRSERESGGERAMERDSGDDHRSYASHVESFSGEGSANARDHRRRRRRSRPALPRRVAAAWRPGDVGGASGARLASASVS